jgi:hypothetical protein
MNVDIEQAIGFAVQIGILVGLIAGGAVWVKKWIRSAVRDPIMKQVEPNGGSQNTTRHLIEEIKAGNEIILKRLDDADITSNRNYTLAVSAQTLAQHTADRLDKWLLEGRGRG